MSSNSSNPSSLEAAHGALRDALSTFQAQLDLLRAPIAQLNTQLAATTTLLEEKRRRADELAVWIDQRLAVERKLLEIQHLESLGALAGGLAHEFNNLLMTILGNAELALFDTPPDTEVAHCLTAIVVSTRRAETMTGQLLAFAGQGYTPTQPIDLNALITSLDSLLRLPLPKAGTLRYQLAAKLPPIVGDALRLRQLLINLVTNAAESFGATGGTILIKTSREQLERKALDALLLGAECAPGQYVRLSVQDNGPGMDASTLERLFDPFFSTKFLGRGLGLPAVLGIVRSHAGALRIVSSPGKGTNCDLWFPALVDPAA